MSPLDRFVAALEARDCRPRLKGHGKGEARCPAHEDKQPSLTFKEGDDGRVLFDCKTGCSFESVVAALGLEPGDLFNEEERRRAERPAGRSTGRHDPVPPSLPSEDDLAVYREDLLGDELMLAGLAKLRGWTPEAITRLGVGVVTPEAVSSLGFRNDGLRRLILPIHDEHGALVNVVLYAPNPRTRGRSPKALALKDHPRDLFPAPETLDKDGPLLLVEGEPDAISVATLDLPATGVPGVGTWKSEWTDRIKGRETVVIFDCDVQGRDRAIAVSEELLKAGGSVRLLDLAPQRIDGYDVGDFVRAAQSDTERAGARDVLLRSISLVEKREPFRLRPMSGRDFVSAVPKHDPRDDFLGPLFRRGQRVAIGGHTGHGKTTLILQAIAAAAYGEMFLKWRGRGDVRCLIVDLEQGEKSLAKRLRETGIAERNGNVQIVNIPQGLELDRKLEQRAAVESALAAGGWDIVLLDPAYQLVAEEPTEDAQAQALVRMLDGWRNRFGFCLVIPMHCRKASQPGQRLTISDIHGRGMMLRNAEVVIGIERVKKGEAKLHWWKDRDGDLDVPLSGYWTLSFDRERLFQWAASSEDDDEEAEAA